MAVFCKLAAPETYVPCHWDLVADRVMRDIWLDHFAGQIESTLAHAVQQYTHQADVRQRAEAVRREFLAALEARRKRPADYAPLTIISLDHLRQALLDQYGLPDPYLDLRRRENRAMLGLYPRRIEELDHGRPSRRLLELVLGVFAGNIFDMGSLDFLDRFPTAQPDFFKTCLELDRRPWLVDDFEVFSARFKNGATSYRQAMFFTDNAGSDLVLGALPMIRQMARWGMRVVISGNTRAALNDSAAEECRQLCREVSRIDPVFADLYAADRISVVANGNTIPLIDLSKITDECNQAAMDCDLVILEGMGRALESNYLARFTCDCLKIALIKNKAVADRFGGRLYDAVFRYEPAPRR